MTSYSLRDYWKKQKDNLVKAKKTNNKKGNHQLQDFMYVYVYIYTCMCVCIYIYIYILCMFLLSKNYFFNEITWQKVLPERSEMKVISVMISWGHTSL